MLHVRFRSEIVLIIFRVRLIIFCVILRRYFTSWFCIYQKGERRRSQGGGEHVRAWTTVYAVDELSSIRIASRL